MSPGDVANAVAARPQASTRHAVFPFTLYLLLLLSPFLLLHNDLGWHLRSGELILHQGAVPLSDPWATTTQGFPWLNSSWGWDCLSWIVYDHLGFSGLLCGTAVLGAILGALVAASGEASGAKSAVVILVSAWMVLALLTYEQPEIPLSVAPQTVTLVCLAGLQLALLKSGGRQPWWTALLFAGWANLHGGYVAGDLAIVVGLGQYVRRHGTAGLSRELGLVGLCALAPLLSPYGVDNYTYFFRHLSTPANDFIFEWKPYAFDRSALASGFIVAFLLSLASPRVRRSPLLVQSVLWLVTGLRHQRNIALFMVSAAPLVATGVSALLRADMRAVIPRWVSLLASAVLIVCSGRIVHSRFTGEIDWPADMYPAQEIDYLREHLAGRRLYNHWNFGSFIIFRAGGRVPVFVDGRGATAYPPSLLKDLRDLALTELLDKYEIEVVLIPLRATGIRAELEERGMWEREVSGKSAIIYRRTGMTGPLGSPGEPGTENGQRHDR